MACRDEKSYKAWLLRLVGIIGNPLRGAARERNKIAKGGEAFGYPQAWKNSPSGAEVAALHRVLKWRWDGLPTVCDPTAGGGAIPFAAVRFGLPTVANDLNGVAVAVQFAGVVYPARMGTAALADAEFYAGELASQLEQELAEFFPSGLNEQIAAFLYAYEVPAPRTGYAVPLLPNLWLDRGGDAVAIDVG